MKRNILGLQGDIPVNCVLHIGAGLGTDLKDYLAAGIRRVILVEPEKDCASVLKEHSERHDEVEFLQCAVSHESGKQTLHRFSFSDLNGLLPSSALNTLYPGLVTLPSQEVLVRDIGELVVELDLDVLLGPNLLVIDAPGQGHDILPALADKNLLRTFRFIKVRDCREQLYEEGGTIGQAEDWFQAHGFEHQLIDKTDDNDWLVVEAAAREELYSVFPLATHLTEVAEMNARLEAAEVAAKELAERVAEQIDALNTQFQSAVERGERLEDRAIAAETALDETRGQLEELETREKQVTTALSMAEGQMELLKDLLLPGCIEREEDLVRD